MQEQECNDFTRYFVIWICIAVLNAAYSFIVAVSVKFPVYPMALIVFMFAAGLALFTQTNQFRRIKNNRELYRSVWIGYVLNAAVVPAHMFTGIAAVTIVENVFGTTKTILATLGITTLQGIFLNISSIILVLFIFITQKVYQRIRNTSAEQAV